MALDTKPVSVDDRARHSTGPLAASLRWGLGWTIVAATLGTSAACVSTAPVEAPIDEDDSYSACVSELGDMPDAANHHIDACAAVARASASMH
jgi:hypothetical protein